MSPVLKTFVLLLIVTVSGKYYLYVLQSDSHEAHELSEVARSWFQSQSPGLTSGDGWFWNSTSSSMLEARSEAYAYSARPGGQTSSGGYDSRQSYMQEAAGLGVMEAGHGVLAGGTRAVSSSAKPSLASRQTSQNPFDTPMQQHLSAARDQAAGLVPEGQPQSVLSQASRGSPFGDLPQHHGGSNQHQSQQKEQTGNFHTSEDIWKGDSAAATVKLNGEAEYIWVFHNADGGYKYNHMATSEVLPGGRLVVAWQRGHVSEGLNDQELVWSISSDNGRTWTTPQAVPGRQSGIMWCPSLFRPPGGRLYLFYTESHGCWWCESIPCFKQHCKSGAANCDVTVKFGEASINLAKLSREALLRRRLFGGGSGGGAKRGAKPSGGGASKPPTWRAGGDLKMVPADFVGGDLKWGEAKVILSEQAFGPVPKVIANPPIVDPKTGSWVLPYWRETPRGEVVCPTKAPGGDYAAVLISSNKGASWRSHSSITMPNPWKNLTKPDWLIEGSVAPSADGTALLQMFRTAREVAYMARSDDGGNTWQPAKPTPLRNPNAKMNILRLSNGALAAAYNNHGSEQYKRRSLLTISVSADDGKTWEDLIVLETRLQQELRFHYPMIRQMECELLVTYSVMTPMKSSERGGIRLVTLPVCFGESHHQCPC